MDGKLRTEFAGVNLPNPFMLASAPPTGNCEMVARAFESGWGGAVLKTVARDLSVTQNVTPRIAAYKSGNVIHGFTNIELASMIPISDWAEQIFWLKERFPQHPVFISILHAEVLVEEEWRSITRYFNDTGIDGFELNLSCSHGMAEAGGGAQIGGNRNAIKEVTRWVCEETCLPVMPKLPVMVSDICDNASAAKEAGASAVAAINTINSLPGIDLYNFTPYPSVNDKSSFSGLSGRAIKPIALRSVAKIASSVDIPISGMGGIYTWQDAAMFLLAGASSLQICSLVMEKGYKCIDSLTRGLSNYMDEMEFESISAFVGKALAKIVTHNDLSRNYRAVASCDTVKCTGCTRCVTVCEDSGYSAIRMSDGYAFVDVNKCDGCGLCTQICPVGALSMRVI